MGKRAYFTHLILYIFGDPQKLEQIVYKFENFRDDKGIVVLQFYIY